MKQLLIPATLLLLSATPSPRFQYTLQGHIEGLTDSVSLVDGATNDTLARLPVIDGSFSYRGSYDQPTRVTLMEGSKIVGLFYIEPGDIRIQGRLNVKESSNRSKIEYFTSGTPANDAFGAHCRFQYRALHACNFEKHDQAYDKAVMDSLFKSPIRNLAANTDNIFGVSQIDGVQHYDRNMSRKELDSILNLFPAHLRQCRLMKMTVAEVERAFLSQELAQCTDFTTTDDHEKPVTLSRVMKHNRYILLDFWFADCGACRVEMPHIKDAYNTFGSKEFEVVGVSVDKDVDQWKAAVAEDGMTWVNLLDSKRGVCDLYSVTKFPTNYLIDCSTGKIVARDLRGKTLGETLEQLFSKQP